MIGREGCAILTPAADARASRQHALVRLCGEAIEVQDLDSSNGTYLDERRLSMVTRWPAGGVLRCGQTTFRLIGEAPPPRSAPTMMMTTAYVRWT